MPLTVKELIEKLSKFPSDSPVYFESFCGDDESSGRFDCDEAVYIYHDTHIGKPYHFVELREKDAE